MYSKNISWYNLYVLIYKFKAEYIDYVIILNEKACKYITFFSGVKAISLYNIDSNNIRNFKYLLRLVRN